ncbi:MAG: membrane dipeptidase [Longimicrobiales bacterium]
MSIPRKDFLKGAVAAGLGASLGPERASGAPGEIRPGSPDGAGVQDPTDWTSLGGSVQQTSHGKSVHTVLEESPPFLYVDPCMQVWPDADFHLMHRHGVTAYGVTAWDPHADIQAATDGLMYWHGIVREHPDLMVVRTVEDIRRAKAEGKAGLLLAAQDGDWVGYDLGRIQAMADLGLRMMLLVYNANNQLAGGSLDRVDGGLSRLGIRVVEECNRVGIVLDCSHTAKRSSLEIMERSAHPCVFSHSNPAAISPNPRNIDDEQIRACIAGGGVVALVSWGPLCMRPGTTHRPTLEEFFRIIDHVVNMAGNMNHVAISTDMSIGTYPDHVHDPFGAPGYPDITAQYDQHVTDDFRSPMRQVEGFGDYADIVQVAEGLSDWGYSDEDVNKILAENFLRVCDEVWPGE